MKNWRANGHCDSAYTPLPDSLSRCEPRTIHPAASVVEELLELILGLMPTRVANSRTSLPHMRAHTHMHAQMHAHAYIKLNTYVVLVAFPAVSESGDTL